mmetsp:Transcript_105387/g.183292  ORF Transcript_105387/g.183292 Transcript_105387/m.183292 type:complete len:303 (+) Transcript_105387:40-948(+)
MSTAMNVSDQEGRIEHEENCCLECWENYSLLVPGGPENVQRAWYGDPANPWGEECGMICTENILQQMRAKDNIVIVSNLRLGCDPVPGVKKKLFVEVHADRGDAVTFETSPALYSTADEVPSAPRWIAFVRHAQAGHNVDRSLLANPDNHLTPDGIEQALAARAGAAGEAVRAADVVVTSPLMRAMQTAALLRGESHVRVVVDAIGTERWSCPADEGTPKSDLLNKVDASWRSWEGWDALADHWWATPGEDPWQRVDDFQKMLHDRPEDRIVFVGHGGFWDMVIGRHLHNCEAVYCERFLSS